MKELVDPSKRARAVLFEYLSATIRPKWESVEDCMETEESEGCGDLRTEEGKHAGCHIDVRIGLSKFPELAFCDDLWNSVQAPGMQSELVEVVCRLRVPI
jgi:hypothetical protein